MRKCSFTMRLRHDKTFLYATMFFHTTHCSFTSQHIVLSGHETLPMLSRHGHLLVFHFVIRWHVQDDCSPPLSLCLFDLFLLGVHHCTKKGGYDRLDVLRIGQRRKIVHRLKQRVPKYHQTHSLR